MTLPELTKIVKNWAVNSSRPAYTHSLIETEVEQTMKHLSDSIDRIELAARRARADTLHGEMSI